ncbi:hypothetical protein Egran_05300 [Elaphomyces granulatus]|uniref:ribonuclease T2 n=1 Tax=Elaphomyces granulatus TaxID=519963 RepID=A0A232LS74_9EURO|nr:hypothetical protein Egran_05300 [Elaphomyces granulatus]
MQPALQLIYITVLLLLDPAFASLYGESNLNHSCVLVDPVLSCSANARFGEVDSCCVETFGGLVLSTQFWDTYTGLEAKGQVLPEGSWTLHGLWPDFCNGSFTQYCDLNRQYDPAPSPNTTTGTVVPPWKGPSIDTFLQPFGKYDLLAYMNKYWISQGSPNYDLWAHEFSKHATCYSTFDTPCYGDPPAHIDWLGQANINPSNKTAYTLSEIEWALKQASGATPYDKRTTTPSDLLPVILLPDRDHDTAMDDHIPSIAERTTWGKALPNNIVECSATRQFNAILEAIEDYIEHSEHWNDASLTEKDVKIAKKSTQLEEQNLLIQNLAARLASTGHVTPTSRRVSKDHEPFAGENKDIAKRTTSCCTTSI